MTEQKRFGQIRERNTTHERALFAAGIAIHEIVALIGIVTYRNESFDFAWNFYCMKTHAVTTKCVMLDMQGNQAGIHAYDELWAALEELTVRLLFQLRMAIRVKAMAPITFEEDQTADLEPAEDLQKARVYLARIREPLVNSGSLKSKEADNLEVLLSASMTEWLKRAFGEGMAKALVRLNPADIDAQGVLVSKMLESSLYESDEQPNVCLN